MVIREDERCRRGLSTSVSEEGDVRTIFPFKGNTALILPWGLKEALVLRPGLTSFRLKNGYL
jgi:hypothetical protein